MKNRKSITYNGKEIKLPFDDIKDDQRMIETVNEWSGEKVFIPKFAKDIFDLQKQGKTSKKGIRVKGKGKSFMDVYKKTVYNRADGGMVPFGGEKRVPGSGAATRGTGFKGIF